MKDFVILQANEKDIDEIESLFGAVCDRLAAGINYSNWSRQRYPTRQTAEEGVAAKTLFVLKTDGIIAGTVVLNQAQMPGYAKGSWTRPGGEGDFFAVHTVAVRPDYQKRGYSAALMAFAKDYAREQGAKSLRLDVCEFNTPAVSAYEKEGFQCVGRVNLFGLPAPYDVYRLYEFPL